MLSFVVNNVATIDFILIDVALGLSIYITLNAGLLTLANAGFMAIGAYTAAIVSSQPKLPLAVGLVAGITLAVLVAWPFGLLVLRLRDLYLAIATLGFGEIVRIIALNGDTLLGPFLGQHARPVFNGGEGITLPYGTPRLILGLPDMTWVLLAFVLLVSYGMAALHRSRHGRVLAAIRLDESAAATLGVDVVRYKLLTFLIGAGIAAGAGALSTPIVRVVDPSSFTFGRAVDILSYAVFGGMTHWIGPIVGATLLTALPESLRFLKDQREVVNGTVIMISIIYLPRGLADPRFWGRVWRRPTARSTSRSATEFFTAPRSPEAEPVSLGPPKAGDAPALLEVEQVTCRFGGLTALDRVSFKVAAGTIRGLIGPNGAGKTTLINLISGLLPLSDGGIVLEGRRIDGLDPHEIAVRGVGRTFQNIRLFADLSVLDNVMVGHHARQRAGLFEALLQLPRSRVDERASREDARKLLQRLRLEHLAEVDAGTLSYGDQRRVEIARALAMDPKILLLDEPAAGLNPVETSRLSDFLLELRDAGLTMLVVEHDMDLIMHVSDAVVVLNFGQKIAEERPDAIRRDPRVVQAYLGDDAE